MLFELAEPVLGQTHIYLDHVEVFPTQAIRLSGTYGTVVNGTFQSEPMIARINRWLRDAEYNAFCLYVVSQGLPLEKVGSFRGDDVGYWLGTYGVETSTWAPE